MEKYDDYENVEDGGELYHYGTPQMFPGDPHGSGRYREGSGDNPGQHGNDDTFLTRYNEMRKSGMKETDIARVLGFTSTGRLRARVGIENERLRSYLVDECVKLREEGKGPTASSRTLGIPESDVRKYLKDYDSGKKPRAMQAADNLQKVVDKYKIIDVGKSSEMYMGVSRGKLDQAVNILEEKGYVVNEVDFPQVTNTKQYTKMKVLCTPDITYDYIKKHPEEIRMINDVANVSDDGDSFYKPFEYPSSMDKSRLAVRYSDGAVVGGNGTRYAEQSSDAKLSGVAKDGLIEVRPGCKDLYFGDGCSYCQARILVDGTHYIKGMAVYSNDLPDGVDVLFNTNKNEDTPILGPKDKTVLKCIHKDDPNNPFGSAIKENGGQSYYPDPNGKYKDGNGNPVSLSLINKRAEEGDWNDWSKELPSQFLSKQNVNLIRRQLALAAADREEEFKEINNLTNPEVKKQMLSDFADSCDSASVSLKAATLPGQRYQVIIPLTSISDGEIYAPNFTDGSRVALVRYPHAGTFEIPVLTVNNRNKEGNDRLRSASSDTDAVGISKNVADQLSGADFDGDTVMVVPLNNEKYKINSRPPLSGLKGFDPTMEYGPDKIIDSDVSKDGKTHYYRNGVEFEHISPSHMQNLMGQISNLITDMTLQNATDDELTRAVKHSMVVIDSDKHNLDYKQSYIDNGIAALKKKYQGRYDANGRLKTGASTLISRAKAQVHVPERKEGEWYTRDGKTRLVPINEKETSFANPNTAEVYSRGQVKLLKIDPKTGKKLYHETGALDVTVTYKDSDGNKIEVKGYNRASDGSIVYKPKGSDSYVKVTDEKVKIKPKTTKSTQMSETDNAMTLSRGTVQEKYYAAYANKMKNLANQARLNILMAGSQKYSPAAKKAYAQEVLELDEELRKSELNAPLERQAQLLANGRIRAIVEEDPTMYEDKDRYKKMKNMELANARAKVNAQRHTIEITPKQWEAIQAGAISANKLTRIMRFCDKDKLKQMATPKSDKSVLSPGKQARMKSMLAKGYTNDEVAKALGVSVSTVLRYARGEEDK